MQLAAKRWKRKRISDVFRALSRQASAVGAHGRSATAEADGKALDSFMN
jgi:hypothetical protein